MHAGVKRKNMSEATFWKIFMEVPKDLRVVIMSFIPSKSQARQRALLDSLEIDDAYVDEIIDKGEDWSCVCVSVPCKRTRRWARFDSERGIYRVSLSHFTVGTRRAMRLKWAEYIENMVEYCEDNGEDFDDVDEAIEEYENHTWDEFIDRIGDDKWYGEKVYIHEEK